MRCPCTVGVPALEGLWRTQLIRAMLASVLMWQTGVAGACTLPGPLRVWRPAREDALESQTQGKSPCTSSLNIGPTEPHPPHHPPHHAQHAPRQERLAAVQGPHSLRVPEECQPGFRRWRAQACPGWRWAGGQGGGGQRGPAPWPRGQAQPSVGPGRWGGHAGPRGGRTAG